MESNATKTKRKRKFTYLSSIISIAMVLFMLGLFGIIYKLSGNLTSLIKENVRISAYLIDNAEPELINQTLEKIKLMEEIKEIRFISKEQAALEQSREMGEDIVGFLGYNPLPSTIEISLKANFVGSKNLENVKHKLSAIPIISEVNLQQLAFEKVDKNLNSLAFILIGIAILFILISIVLINNTVRLNIFARRFLIKSMQLVGATHWFIIKPFAKRGILNGLYGGLIAVTLLVGLLSVLPNWVSQIEILYDRQSFAILFIVLILAGIIISFLSSWFSAKRFLKIKIEDLY